MHTKTSSRGGAGTRSMKHRTNSSGYLKERTQDTGSSIKLVGNKKKSNICLRHHRRRSGNGARHSFMIAPELDTEAEETKG